MKRSKDSAVILFSVTRIAYDPKLSALHYFPT